MKVKKHRPLKSWFSCKVSVKETGKVLFDGYVVAKDGKDLVALVKEAFHDVKQKLSLKGKYLDRKTDCKRGFYNKDFKFILLEELQKQ